jgi:hypothetical protein
MDSPKTSYKSSPLKFISRSGRASNNYFNALYSSYKAPPQNVPRDSFDEFLSDFKDIYVSPRNLPEMRENEEEGRPKVTAASREGSRETIYKKSNYPEPGRYNPNFQSLSRRNDRAPVYKSSSKTQDKGNLVEEVEKKHKIISDRHNTSGDTEQSLKVSPRRLKEIPEKPAPKLVYSLDFKRQSPRKEIIPEAPHPQRFNYYPNDSPKISRNKRTASLDFRKMLNRSSYEFRVSLGDYNPNYNYNKPKIAKSIIGFEKQVPRYHHSRYLSDVSAALETKHIEKAFHELNKLKSLPSFPKPEKIVSQPEIETKLEGNYQISKTLQEAVVFYQKKLAKNKHNE